MTGETQHARAVKESDSDSKEQDEGSLPARFSIKVKQEPEGQYKCGGLESRAISRAKEYTQREAVIRPQQAGKIDFKSLQNRPKFSSDRTWPSGKGSPQSPSGKSRTRDRSKKSVKAERSNPQQLYRLSISNPRSNPTIGIAYPQQKVTPPKKLETSPGPISGSYRFHVPSIPEREAELQQEELNYNRCFQEASSNLTTTNYTSQAESAAGGAPAHQHPVPPQQQPVPRENSSSQPSSQLLYPEFPVNRTASWQSQEKNFSGANYGVSSQKPTSFPEGDKVNASIVPLPFTYGYPPLQDSPADAFPCNHNTHPQDYLEVSLPTGQVTHASFAFHSSGEGQEDAQTDSQFSSKQPEGRSPYTQLPQHAQYLQSPHEAQSSVHCHNSRKKHSTNSENSVTSLHHLEQSKSTMPDNPGSFNPVDSEGVASMSVNEQNGPPNLDSAASQRILTQGSAHHARNIAHNQSPQMHFPSKAYSSSPINTMHVGSGPLEKSITGSSIRNHSRLPEAWEGANKTFSSMDQTSYSSTNDKYQFQCQPVAEQRQPTSCNRMAWQQIQLTTAMPKQNRIQLSRQLSNQKLAFPVGAFDWQETKKPHKNGPLNSFHNKRPSEGFTNLRQETIKENCTNTSSFPFDNRVEAVTSPACEARSKSVYYGVNQSLSGPPSKTNSHDPSQVPPVGLMTATSYESPMPSPIQNPASNSPCSSLSPPSHSPVNISPEDSQVQISGPPPPLYHQHQGKTLIPSDHLNSNLHHFHTDLSRSFPNHPERAKEDMMSYLHNNKGSRPNTDGGKTCMNNFGVEHPPPPPPPPYATHQLLASSLAAANLDQLDVLLTCKQCDQNFNNLASFLDHKQYCGQHMSTQNNIFKSGPKMEETRKFQTDSIKTSSSGMSFPLSRCSSDMNLSLLGLSKNGELMSDIETKVDPKDESLKLNLFPGTNTLPVTLPDLEMDDAKLDSLITETLNGLGYQSDNAEIDSSFIDAFVDDDLTTSQNLKSKDSMFNSRNKHEASTDEKSQTQGKHLYDLDKDSMSTETKNAASIPEKTLQDFKQKERANLKEATSHKKSRGPPSEKFTEQSECVKEERKSADKMGEKSKRDSRLLLSRKFSERCKLKSFQEHSSLLKSSLPQASSTNWSGTTSRVTAREGKRRKTGGGTWSKELIHKIVQQKNKPHNLQVKGTKTLLSPLVTERITPVAQSPKFGEYDYVSDSDEESEPLRIASRGRLGHASRCRYTYSKEHKGRDKLENEGSAPWTPQTKDRGVVKTAEDASPSPLKEISVQRVRRRSSRSSSSSELSEPASISSESITSPKTTDRTDSDSERGLALRRVNSGNLPLSDSFHQDTGKRLQPKTLKEPATTTTSTLPIAPLSLTFSKNTKKYGSARFLLSTERGRSSTSKIPNPSDRSTESQSELSKTSEVRDLMVDYTAVQSSKEKKEQCTTAVGMKERAEELSHVKRADRISYGSLKGVPDDFHTPGAHSRLLVAEVMPDTKPTDCKKINKNKKSEILTQEKLEHKKGEHSKLGSYSAALQPSSEIPAIPTFEKIGAAVYPSKDEMHNSGCDVIANCTPHCTTHFEEVCLCPVDMQDPAVQKDSAKHGLVPYTIEPDPSLMKSPLSFDTSSMFGDLTVASFDNSLYTDISKEGFNTFCPRNDKRELFESSFPHLGHKDWNLIADDPPVLPEDLSDKAINRKINSSHMQFPQPDKMMEDNPNFISNLPEDELEIKRIVTELETQLQTSKYSNSPLLANKLSKQLNRNNFSPLRLDHNAGSEQSCMSVDDEESRRLGASSPTTDPDLTLWSSPFQLGLLEGQQDLHTPVHADNSTSDHSCMKADSTATSSPAAEDLEPQEMKGTDGIKDLSTEKSEEMLENEMYTENLMKSLEVISDSIFNKGSLTAELEKSNVSQFINPEQSSEECTDGRDNHSEKEGMCSGERESHKSEKQNVLVVTCEKTDCSLDVKGDLSPQPREPKMSITTCEPENSDMPVSESVMNVNESHNRSKDDDIHLVLDKQQSFEDEVKAGKILLNEDCQTEEEGHSVLREPPSQPMQTLSSNVHSEEKDLVISSYPTMIPVNQSPVVSEEKIIHSEDKEDSLAKLSIEEFHSEEKKPEDSDNSESPHSFSICEGPREGGEGAKEDNSLPCLNLQQPDEMDEVLSIQPQEETCKAIPSQCSTPDHIAANAVVQFPQDRNTDSSCSLSLRIVPESSHCHSVESEAIGSEKSELTLAEHASTLQNEPLVLTTLEHETEAGPECADIPPQVLCGLTESPLHALSTINAVRTEENCTGTEARLSPLSSSLPRTEDPSIIQQCKGQSMWTQFESPPHISMHNGQPASRGSCDQMKASEIQLCGPPVTMASGMSHLSLPQLEIGIEDNKSSGADPDDSNNISSDDPFISTVEPSKSPSSESPSTGPVEILEHETSLDLLSEFQQTPLIFKEISSLPHQLTECSDVMKRSPKDTRGHCKIMPLASISPISPTPDDKDAPEMVAGSDTPVCFHSLNTSLQSIQASTNFPALPCPEYKDSSMSTITNVILDLNNKPPQDIHDLDICHSPLETIDYMDLHIDLIKKAEAETLDLHASPTDQSVLSLKQVTSDGQENLQPLLKGTEDVPGLPLCQSETMKEEDPLSTFECTSKMQTDAKANQNDSRKKSAVQKKNSVQGTILCEICSACFRTVPGLKRHKAMKHFTKKNGNLASEDHQASISIPRDDSALLDSQVGLHMDSSNVLSSATSVPSFTVNQKELNLIIGGTRASEASKTAPEGKDKQRMNPPVTKSKKSWKAQKTRELGSHNGCLDPKTGKLDPFPDELLSLLKTDILQAISPNFPTMPRESYCQPEKQDKVNTAADLEVKQPESFPFQMINNTGKKDTAIIHTDAPCRHEPDEDVDSVDAVLEEAKHSGSDVIGNNTLYRNYEEPRDDFYDMREQCVQKEICSEDTINRETLGKVTLEVKCEKAISLTDRLVSKPCCFKPPSPCSPRPSQDLESLLDDESTFSQLFPRDEEMIRKKCAKVYGKRNKKHNPDSNLPLVKAYPIDSMSLDKKEQISEGQNDQIVITKMRDHCEYETISIDDAIMLDMCHKSTVKNDCEKISYIADQCSDDVDSGMLGPSHFLCLTDDPICKTAIEWNGSGDLTNIVTEGVQSLTTTISCKTEDSAMSFPPQLSDLSGLHSSDSRVQENLSHFHGIDIQNLNTKFQLPEIQFLESSEDVPVVLPIPSEDMSVSQSARANKKPSERRGRRRLEGGLKPKDKQYKCKVCFTWFLTLGELNFHKLSHNPSPPPTCYMCVQRKFSSREQLRDHLREKHAKNKAGIWTCGMCLKEISDVWMYNEHLREHATQFARKGQTQSSILGLPGCFMQETAVKNFITSIMQHRPSKGSKGEVGKVSSKEGVKTIKDNIEQDAKTSEGGESTGVKAKGASGAGGKRTMPILSEIAHKADISQKNVEMHPNCKDPSRDCHHCGKQFPKPFKLQRHLVVHSLQKIFLCSKCPISYQDAKELKDHLKSEHEEMEEQDSKHTTLYTCELCADVMHVIKKSFICSTCNYTFSKKEQFDRHMEKHLSGGNEIFKFRGVVRPSKPSASSAKNGEFDLPPTKRRKVLTDRFLENNSDSGIANIAPTQFSQSSEKQVPKAMSPTCSDLTETSGDISSGSTDADIKTEDIAGDFSEILMELEHSKLQAVSESTCFPEVPSSEQDADVQTGEACKEDDTPSEISDIKEENYLHSNQEKSSSASPPLTECVATDDEAGIKVNTPPPPLVDSTETASASAAEATVQNTEMSDSSVSIEESHDHFSENVMNISEAPSLLEEVSLPCCSTDTKKSLDAAVELTGSEEKSEHLGETQRNESEEKEAKALNSAEQQSGGQGKDDVFSKPSESANDALDDGLTPAGGQGAMQATKHCYKPTSLSSGKSEEKVFARQQKKRKELKTSQSSKGSSSATRENLDVDMKNRKKLRVQSPSKCDWTGGYRKADAASEYPVLSCMRDDKVSNKIPPKHKAGGLNIQPKRNTLDCNPPKKTESIRHLNGAYKGKKGVPGRPLHPPASKTSVPIVNNSFNKYRPLSGVRPVETHAYRTAESQNHLLSQLFGQKLTSFKIPLRKDTSEALN